MTVVGVDYAYEDKTKSDPRIEMLLFAPGEPVDLRPEPKNSHDKNAIAAFSVRGLQLGYLNAERALWIGRKIKAGRYLGRSFRRPRQWPR